MSISTAIDLSEINVHELLKARRQIAIVWSVEDVQEVRPDLTAEQSWEVLQSCEAAHDCELGITWLSLEVAADVLFPSPSDQ